MRTYDREALALCAVVIVVGIFLAASADDPGGAGRMLGVSGLTGIAAWAAALGVRVYRAGEVASLPGSVARVRVRTRPPRGFSGLAVAVALGLPVGLLLAAVVLVEWAWIVLAIVLLLAAMGAATTGLHAAWADRRYGLPPRGADELLERLCMRADMRVPELVVEHGAAANCWTAAGRIHVTSPLLDLLDERELEAVLAHELAHVAHRDAAVMEICSAPSRILLGFARFLTPRAPRLIRDAAREGIVGLAVVAIVVGLCIPPAFVLGWISRLSVLGMSRAREFSADTAAAALTGRPSALASALLKLDRQRAWTPRADLRQVYGHEVLCIVGVARRRLGRLLSTHPPIAARVKRLEETETRIQAGPYRSR